MQISMKYLLIFTICSMMDGSCLPIKSTGRTFDTFKQCSLAGYEMIHIFAKEFDKDMFEEIRPAFIFDCKDILTS